LSSDTRPRILLIKPILPYPPDQGTKVLSFSVIRALQPNFAVTILARILDPGEEARAAELAAFCERVVTVPAPNRRSLFHRVFFRIFYYLKSALLRRSKKMLYDCPGVFLGKARELAREDFDLIIIEYWQLQRMASLFPRDKVVLLTHDVDMLVNRQSTLLERNLIRKVQQLRNWLLEQKEEIRAYRSFRRILALTERDRDMVRKIAGSQAQVEVLPFGLETADGEGTAGERNKREVLFRDALDFFIRFIYPHIDSIEGLSFTIVGGVLPPELAYFEKIADVNVVGRVEDVRPYLAGATCLIVPLRFGGGLRIRILEAMLAGLPIVCSSVAIAGMPFTPDEDYLLAEEPEEYGAQIERLVEDPQLAARLAENAGKKVRELYGREQQGRQLEKILREYINSK
jgi:glycosyltransferase involved in cell wall biosynthesis